MHPAQQAYKDLGKPKKKIIGIPDEMSHFFFYSLLPPSDGCQVPIDISRSHHGDMIDDPPHVAPVDLVHAVLHMRRQQSYRGSREESE